MELKKKKSLPGQKLTEQQPKDKNVEKLSIKAVGEITEVKAISTKKTDKKHRKEEE